MNFDWNAALGINTTGLDQQQLMAIALGQLAAQFAAPGGDPAAMAAAAAAAAPAAAQASAAAAAAAAAIAQQSVVNPAVPLLLTQNQFQPFNQAIDAQSAHGLKRNLDTTSDQLSEILGKRHKADAAFPGQGVQPPPARLNLPAVEDQAPPDPEEIEWFLSSVVVDERIAQQFRAMPPQMQSLVLSAGTMADAKDPTAVLVTRMKKARQGQVAVQQPTQPGDWYCPSCGDLNFARNVSCRKCYTRCPDKDTNSAQSSDGVAKASSEVEEFIETYKLARVVADALRDLPEAMQQSVLTAGPLADARDPTAVVMSRIKKIKGGKLTTYTKHVAQPGDWRCPQCSDMNFARNVCCRKCNTANPELVGEGGEIAPAGSDVELFILTHGLAKTVADALRVLPPETQQVILHAGPLNDARDKTAVVMSRIQKLQRGQLELHTIGAEQPGDWYCPSCGEMNFARNAICRRCSTPNPTKPYTPQPQIQINPENFQNVELFIIQNGIVNPVADELRMMPAATQQIIMAAGTLVDARDPTAVIKSRINKSKSGTLTMQPVSEGDWHCPVCQDLQFARNLSCRKCGLPNPKAQMFG